MRVWLVIQNGVYRHDIRGVYSSPSKAEEAARRAAAEDEDCHHDYTVHFADIDAYVDDVDREPGLRALQKKCKKSHDEWALTPSYAAEYCLVDSVTDSICHGFENDQYAEMVREAREEPMDPSKIILHMFMGSDRLRTQLFDNLSEAQSAARQLLGAEPAVHPHDNYAISSGGGLNRLYVDGADLDLVVFGGRS